MRRAGQRWRHPWYRQAYCYPRTMKDGEILVYTSVDTIRRATGIVWKPQNKVHAMRVLERRRAELHTPAITSSSVSIHEAVDHFIEYKLKHLKKVTIASYIIAFEQYLSPGYDLNDYHRWQQHIIEVNRNMSKKDTTINVYMIRLKTFFKYCVDKLYCSNNPVTSDLFPNASTNEVKVPTDNELLLILANINAKLNTFIKFICITAMRRDEAIKLKQQDITDDYINIMGKGSRQRIFPLNVPLLTKFYVQDELFDISELLPSIPFGWKYSTSPNDVLRINLKKLDLHYSMHSFRKWAIKRWTELGINMEMRSILAGHSVAVQYKHYQQNPTIDYFNHYTWDTHESK